ncbi:unnamed protein product [Dibothriocephalus latus]|uniref:Uncharacterized protein n=1 Tax=Dibothriocephalus latus TaxID=60516 RepID=A0A3P7RTZ2_DIBLA|nr:unnamed protein product [Dibothriocephalus latus]
MQLVLKSDVSNVQNSRGNPPPVTEACTKSTAEQAAPKANCFEVSKHLFPVTVKAKMESTNRILTLNGASNAELTVTFKPKSSGGSTGGSDSSTTSAAAWLADSAALILANLAMMYLLP